MQLHLAADIVLHIVVPDIFAICYFRQKLVAKSLAALLDNGLEPGFHLVPAEATEQFLEAFCAHDAGLDLAVEIGGETLG